MNEGQQHLIRVVEAAYLLDLDEQQWVDRLVEVLAAMRGAAQGLMVYLYDASRPEEGVDISSYALDGLDEDFAQATIEHNANTPPADVRRVYQSGVRCGTVSEVLEPQGILPRDHESFAMARHAIGIEDAWGLSASGPDGRGVGVAAPLGEVSKTSDSTRELWGLVGVHLANAYRLRRRSGADDDDQMPRFGPGGRLVHDGNFSFSQTERERMRHAIGQIDRARSKKLRHTPAEALPLWRGLVEGRWSLIDERDSDGRRFIVAHPNDPQFDQPRALSERERQVVAYVLQGDSDARISYSLGLDEDEVASLIDSALDKLNLASREDLLRLHRTLSG